MTDSRTVPAWDIFCKVVDNYGDAGVCWRLARQLVNEHGQAVRLWCDDLAVLGSICPLVDASLRMQHVRGVEVRYWSDPFPPTDPAEIVVEAFACALPENFLEAMAQRQSKPVWVNLEYLSAEDWVSGCHGMASPHPRLPLQKTFFFPGFTTGTGGLLRESSLIQDRLAFTADMATAFAGIGVAAPENDEMTVSLFAYENAALPALVAAWSAASQPTRCLVPQGRSLDQLQIILGTNTLHPGDRHRRGNLTVQGLPFMAQEDYDKLLWACDLNFVRGEDSFLRAQWAARPFIWHIYPQQDEAHRNKLHAFLDRYCAHLPESTKAVYRHFCTAWNHDVRIDWDSFWRHRKTLATHAETWVETLAGNKDLAKNLLEFVLFKLKCAV